MRWRIEPDPAEFERCARALLAARVEHNVHATVLAPVLERDGPPGAVLAAGEDAAGRLRALALRTPPWPMLVTALSRRDAEALLEIWLERDPGLSGVSGPLPAARAVSDAWRALTGAPTRRTLAEAVHVLGELAEPERPAPGSLRVAAQSDRPLLLAWAQAFTAEAMPAHASGQGPALVDGRLATGRLFVWQDGAPVCMVGTNAPVAGVVRLGPVYTPPELRGRGYATSAVAAVSRDALEQGARTCTLFTDLANPTSNAIYARLGYRRELDWEEHAFGEA